MIWKNLTGRHRSALLCVGVDDRFFSRLADWLVVLIAIALPWSITATEICIVVWLITVVPTLDLTSVRREVLSTAAAGLPVLLWFVGLIGMLWADVGWSERFHGFHSFQRLLVIPLLLAHFRRSRGGILVIYGFLISSAFVLIASYVLVWNPGLTPLGEPIGIAVHDDIFQGSICVICGFGALGCAISEGLRKRWPAVFVFAAIAALFLANFLFIPVFSRIALGVAPVLLALLGWRYFHWRGFVGACLLAAVACAAFWLASPSFRERVHNSLDEFREYTTSNKATSIGMHIAFLKESLTIISSAPLIGHGTGSVPKEFRQVTAGGNGATAVATVNPHNQTFAVAIQTGVIGAIVLWSMWIAHFQLFRGVGIIAWLGTVLVVENIISSAVHTHLFDSTHGWLYVLGVGVLGGMTLHQNTESSAAMASNA